MNLISLIGAFVITLALLSYGIASISIQRFKIITRGMLVFLILGVLLVIIAVTFMMYGSNKGMFTLHGILGYSATLTIIVDAVLIMRSYFSNGIDSVIGESVLLFSKIAFAWYLLVYLIISVLVIWN